MEFLIETAVLGGYLPPDAGKYYGTGKSNSLFGMSSWIYKKRKTRSSFTQTHGATVADPEFWKALDRVCGWRGSWCDYQALPFFRESFISNFENAVEILECEVKRLVIS